MTPHAAHGPHRPQTRPHVERGRYVGTLRPGFDRRDRPHRPVSTPRPQQAPSHRPPTPRPQEPTQAPQQAPSTQAPTHPPSTSTPQAPHETRPSTAPSTPPTTPRYSQRPPYQGRHPHTYPRYTNSPSRSGRPTTLRTWGDGATCGGVHPRLVLRAQIRASIWVCGPTGYDTPTAIRRRRRPTQLCTWPHTEAPQTPSDPSDTRAPTVDRGGDPGRRETETRNAAGVGTGYIPLSVSDHEHTQKGGARFPPQKFSPGEGGWSA